MLVHDEVRAALDAGRPVVALESTIIAHGLPRPGQPARGAGDRGRGARARGACRRRSRSSPARCASGSTTTALEALARTDGVVKCGVRDLAPVVARGGDGATTVAATVAPGRARPGSACSRPAGSAACTAGRATRSTSRRTSGRWPASAICVVCAGVKSILDIPATLERLETLNVTVLGYRTDTFPAFYLTDSGLPVPWRVDTPEEAAAVLRARAALGAPRRRRRREPARTSRSTRRCTRACSREGLAAAAARGGRGPRRDPVPARALPHARRRARACGRTSGSSCATPRWPRRSRRRVTRRRPRRGHDRRRRRA